MVFVHARNATVHTAMYLRETAKSNGEIGMFQPQQTPEFGSALKQVMAGESFLLHTEHYGWYSRQQTNFSLIQR